MDLEKGIKDIENEIESAKAEVERTYERLSSYKGEKNSTAKTILEDKYNKVEEEYTHLKEKKEEHQKCLARSNCCCRFRQYLCG